MELWEILVPTVRKDGKYYKTRFHRVWDAKIREIAGGLTVLSPTKGSGFLQKGNYSQRE